MARTIFAVSAGLAAQGLHWWTGELAGMLPGRAPPGGRRVIVVDATGTAVSVRRVRDGLKEELAALAWDAAPGAIAAAAARLRAGGTARSGALLRLGRREVLRKVLLLPAAAEGTLRQVLRYEVDRHTPFIPDRVAFEGRILARHPELQQVEVELAVVPRATLERAQGLARGLGIEITGVAVEGETHRYAFLSACTARSRRPGLRRLNLALALAAAMLVVALVASALQRERAHATAAATEVAAAKAQAEGIEATRDELDALLAREAFLAARRGPRLLDALGALTRALPDDAYLTDVELDGSSVRMRGLASSATTLLQRLDAPPLATPQLSAPVTIDVAAGRERFDIAVTLAEPKSP
jgi:general secretion pathway protein L